MKGFGEKMEEGQTTKVKQILPTIAFRSGPFGFSENWTIRPVSSIFISP